MTEKIEKLQKIKELAKRGVAGERQAARRLLAALQNKYGITDSELDAQQVEWYGFTYKTKYEKQLLNQVLFQAINKHSLTIKRHKTTLYVETTRPIADVIKVHYAIYRREMDEHFDLMLDAFIQRNDIFPEAPRDVDDDENEPRDFDRLRKILGLAGKLDRVHINKMITD